MAYPNMHCKVHDILLLVPILLNKLPYLSLLLLILYWRFLHLFLANIGPRSGDNTSEPYLCRRTLFAGKLPSWLLGIAKDIFSAQSRVDTVILDEVRSSTRVLVCMYGSLFSTSSWLYVFLLVCLWLPFLCFDHSYYSYAFFRHVYFNKLADFLKVPYILLFFSLRWPIIAIFNESVSHLFHPSFVIFIRFLRTLSLPAPHLPFFLLSWPLSTPLLCSLNYWFSSYFFSSVTTLHSPSTCFSHFILLLLFGPLARVGFLLSHSIFISLPQNSLLNISIRSQLSNMNWSKA